MSDEHERDGWHIDRWTLREPEIVAVANVYRAVLNAGVVDTEIAKVLGDEGIDLNDLLLGSHDTRDDTTRADAIELAAAASFLKIDGWPETTLNMPNVPKMSRKKSDSGIDVSAVILHDIKHDDLAGTERLHLASVKHSIQPNAQGLRYKLVQSVRDELTSVYVASQLRVLHGNLLREGVTHTSADRIFFFLRYLDSDERVAIHAFAAVDSIAEAAFDQDLANLPRLDRPIGLRVAVVPQLPNLHSRCD